MKTIILCLICFLLTGGSNLARCQITSGYYRLIKMSWQSDKRMIVDKLMDFSEKEADGFWPLYDKHMQKWGRLMDYRIAITQEYCDEFDTMRGTQMSQYLKELVKNDIELTRLQKKFFTRVRKVLPAARANQLMEIEYEFQLVLLSQIQQRTPMVGDNLKRL